MEVCMVHVIIIVHTNWMSTHEVRWVVVFCSLSINLGIFVVVTQAQWKRKSVLGLGVESFITNGNHARVPGHYYFWSPVVHILRRPTDQSLAKNVNFILPDNVQIVLREFHGESSTMVNIYGVRPYIIHYGTREPREVSKDEHGPSCRYSSDTKIIYIEKSEIWVIAPCTTTMFNKERKEKFWFASNIYLYIYI